MMQSSCVFSMVFLNLCFNKVKEGRMLTKRQATIAQGSNLALADSLLLGASQDLTCTVTKKGSVRRFLNFLSFINQMHQEP